MGFCAGVCGDREYARGNGLATGDASRSGTGSVWPAVRPNAVGGSVRRLVRLPAAISAPEPCRSGGRMRNRGFRSVLSGNVLQRLPARTPSGGEFVERRFSRGSATRCRNLDRNAGRRGNLSVFAFRPDGYRSGLLRLSGARLFGTGPYAFMSSTDIFRSGRSGRERGPLASFSRRQIFRPRLHKPGEPP